MADNPDYKHNIFKALDRGDGWDGAFKYAAKKHVQMLYNRHHLAHDESAMKKLVMKGFGVYNSEECNGTSRKRSCELGIMYIEKFFQQEVGHDRGQRNACAGYGRPSFSRQDMPQDDGRSAQYSRTRVPESRPGNGRFRYAPDSRSGIDHSAAGSRDHDYASFRILFREEIVLVKQVWERDQHFVQFLDLLQLHG
jgi:hypothetical protein